MGHTDNKKGIRIISALLSLLVILSSLLSCAGMPSGADVTDDTDFPAETKEPSPDTAAPDKDAVTDDPFADIYPEADPLTIPDKLYREERYADRCVFLVGRTEVQGTEAFEASAVYGRVSGRLIGNKYQLNIFDAADCAAFETWLKEKLGESPSEITVDPSWNVTIPTAGELVSKIVRFDGAANGDLTRENALVYCKAIWDVNREKFDAYLEKCVSLGFEVTELREKGGDGEATAFLTGNGIPNWNDPKQTENSKNTPTGTKPDLSPIFRSM